MNIHEIREKIKPQLGFGVWVEYVMLGGIIVMVGLIAFGLGRLSVLPDQRDPASIKIVTSGGDVLHCPGSL